MDNGLLVLLDCDKLKVNIALVEKGTINFFQ
jgi:hypothetical protein